MGHPCWPVFDLRLAVAERELRPTTEADLLALAELLPDDVELDPAAAARTGWTACGTCG